MRGLVPPALATVSTSAVDGLYLLHGDLPVVAECAIGEVSARTARSKGRRFTADSP